ncbi:MAG: cellulase family glycosylhydrolase [Ignavibacteria bacterium]|nr:cellulase family glycosylhydrolase [Ignavibacteria bacterium]
MKTALISVFLFILCFSTTSANEKFSKWQQGSYFRGYNVLYESPKSVQDFIDLKNYGGNLFHIQPDGFFAVDAPYDLVQDNIDGADLLVNFCRQAGIHYVIGMRSGPGAYDTYDESQGTVPESRVWNSGNTVEQQKYAEMLQMIVQRYANDTLFVGINLVIEPRPKVKLIPANTSANYKFFLENVFNIHMDQVYKGWVTAIRQVDPEIPIIIESFAYSTPELFPGYEISGQYIIYSAHNYQPVEFTKAEAPMTMTYPGTYWNITHLSPQLFNAQFLNETVFRKLIEFGENTGAPIFIGELGMFKPQIGGADYLRDVLNICTDNGWNFAIWDWRRGSGDNWNIEAFEDEGNLHWKTVLSKMHAPPVPNPIFPDFGSNIMFDSEIMWDSLTSFTTYDLEISLVGGPGGNRSIQINGLSGARYKITESILQNNTTYQWRVRSKNPVGAPENISNWSAFSVFRIDDPLMQPKAKQNNFSLNQNFPNPFNPSTNISYVLPKNSLVKLVIYDVIGREVVKLVDKPQQQGSYSALFNAASLTSGVYFYRLEAIPIDGTGSFLEIKRMILVK